MQDAVITSDGPTKMADADVCVAVGEDLSQAFPDYPWMVGCNHQAGTIVIDLQVPKPLGLEGYGYLLFLSTVLGPGGRKAVIRAGGELLERFGLPRRSAPMETMEIAREHGLDASNVADKK